MQIDCAIRSLPFRNRNVYTVQYIKHKVSSGNSIFNFRAFGNRLFIWFHHNCIIETQFVVSATKHSKIFFNINASTLCEQILRTEPRTLWLLFAYKTQISISIDQATRPYQHNASKDAHILRGRVLEHKIFTRIAQSNAFISCADWTEEKYTIIVCARAVRNFKRIDPQFGADICWHNLGSHVIGKPVTKLYLKRASHRTAEAAPQTRYQSAPHCRLSFIYRQQSMLCPMRQVFEQNAPFQRYPHLLEAIARIMSNSVVCLVCRVLAKFGCMTCCEHTRLT